MGSSNAGGRLTRTVTRRQPQLPVPAVRASPSTAALPSGSPSSCPAAAAPRAALGHKGSLRSTQAAPVQLSLCPGRVDSCGRALAIPSVLPRGPGPPWWAALLLLPAEQGGEPNVPVFHGLQYNREGRICTRSFSVHLHLLQAEVKPALS